jgi:hypothetical protein
LNPETAKPNLVRILTYLYKTGKYNMGNGINKTNYNEFMKLYLLSIFSKTVKAWPQDRTELETLKNVNTVEECRELAKNTPKANAFVHINENHPFLKNSCQIIGSIEPSKTEYKTGIWGIKIPNFIKNVLNYDAGVHMHSFGCVDETKDPASFCSKPLANKCKEDPKTGLPYEICPRYFTEEFSGDFYQNIVVPWIKNNRSTWDQEIVKFCNKYYDQTYCDCLGVKNPLHKDNKLFQKVQSEYRSSIGCYWLTCQEPQTRFVTDDITTNSVNCPGISCGNFMDAKDTTYAGDTTSLTQIINCNPSSPVVTPTPTPTPSPVFPTIPPPPEQPEQEAEQPDSPKQPEAPTGLNKNIIIAVIGITVLFVLLQK